MSAAISAREALLSAGVGGIPSAVEEGRRESGIERLETGQEIPREFPYGAPVCAFSCTFSAALFLLFTAGLLRIFPLVFLLVYYLVYRVVVFWVYAWHRFTLKSSVQLFSDRLLITPISLSSDKALRSLADHPRPPLPRGCLKCFSSKRRLRKQPSPVRVHEVVPDRVVMCTLYGNHLLITFTEKQETSKGDAVANGDAGEIQKEVWIHESFFRSKESFAEVQRWLTEKVDRSRVSDASAEYQVCPERRAFLLRELKTFSCRCCKGLLYWCLFFVLAWAGVLVFYFLVWALASGIESYCSSLQDTDHVVRGWLLRSCLSVEAVTISSLSMFILICCCLVSFFLQRRSQQRESVSETRASDGVEQYAGSCGWFVDTISRCLLLGSFRSPRARDAMGNVEEQGTSQSRDMPAEMYVLDQEGPPDVVASAV
uniref:Uncharacterized protein n=1 Tax=Chromera velia CCMP2878 TaxID=1169474 RepID=A0A0G4IBA8_9ALVE|eukprot:Cvel_2157.t1-p1 / transcript=Cvel_2157.t1 / gene=Cvel_2157 / organism=Chromera_velia_CCMP2878 / gene_product=hypothetical protein / transcript_product=hypothetical protein / location=Cvel_scaffold83:139294-140574(-) / protein_length=427 / sequence_SO=supercontig / SO=protein_coding / is_pseudo=false